jgi:hypothetical protein
MAGRVAQGAECLPSKHQHCQTHIYLFILAEEYKVNANKWR